MKSSEFYNQIIQIATGAARLDTYYRALLQALHHHQTETPTWELFLEVLTEAGQIAIKNELITFQLTDLNEAVLTHKNGLQNLLEFLSNQIKMIEEQGIPTDSYFNWHISIILERGAAWLTNDGESKKKLPSNPTWSDLYFLFKIGREYE
ncbi:MAG TPA: hypothetical protein DCM08_05825 [Microscillaceae bacterium]|nr:hypothetical protein [Microscillaceae bacterium]